MDINDNCNNCQLFLDIILNEFISVFNFYIYLKIQ